MGYADIADRISTLNDMAVSALGMAGRFMSQMKTYYGITGAEPPTGGNVVLKGYDFKNLDAPDMPTLENNKGDKPTAFEPPEEAFTDTLALPPVYQGPITMPAFSEDEDTWLKVETKIAVNKLFNETGFETIEIGIWNKGIERRRKELYDAEDLVLASFSFDGFDMPNDMMNRELSKTHNPFDEIRLSGNSEITIKMLDLAQQNAQFAIDAGLNGEAMFWSYFSRIASRALQAAKSAAGIGIETFNAKVAGYQALLQAKREEMKGAVEVENATQEAYRESLDIARAELEAYITNISGIWNAYQTALGAYKTEIRSDAAKAETELTWRKFQFRKNIATIKTALENSIAEMNTALSLSALNTGVDASSAMYHINYLSSAISSLQVLVHEGTEQETLN